MAVALLVLAAAQPARADPSCYTRVFSFGDSLADTGNYRFVFPNDIRAPALWPPYGETFFNRSTGRFSNGRVVIDFIGTAQHSHLSLSVGRPISLLGKRTDTEIRSGCAGAAVCAAVLGRAEREREVLRWRGQLRRWRRHGAEPGILAGEWGAPGE